MRRSQRATEAPPPCPIEAVLRDLGADDVPTGVGWVRMRCCLPIHNDRTASASVNHDENRYRCHACGVGGDSYDVLGQVLGLSFTEALEHGSKLTGIPVGKRSRPQRKRRVSELLGGKGGASDSAGTPRAIERDGGRVRRALGAGDGVPR